jgi:DNA (cytosine-5)-methyltransferase 1
MNYYNEIDPFAAHWLRNLIKARHLPEGTVEARSIKDVKAKDLEGFSQCHFFAGIGGWPYALRLAGWPEDKEVWTGSCPCQPFSIAGKRKGVEDERHLWPDWQKLIKKRKPAIVFGEQVASKDGRAWLSDVRLDLERMAYEVGAADLCAAGVGAPHIRQRLWFVADSNLAGSQQKPEPGDYDGERNAKSCGGVGDADPERLQGSPNKSDIQKIGANEKRQARFSNGVDSWSGIKWIECSDGKARPIKPGLEPLAHGLSGRVQQLRAYGNAIVPQVAAEFIKAFMECRP